MDRVVGWVPGERVRAVKNIAMTEDFFEFHFPKRPVMPGVMLLEAMVQAAGWLEAAGSDFARWFLLEKVDRCMFYGFALPGDRVDVDVERLPASGPDVARFRGLCAVDGRKRVSAEFEGITLPLAEIEDPDECRNHFKFLTRATEM